jgi:hypothetical protein
VEDLEKRDMAQGKFVEEQQRLRSVKAAAHEAGRVESETGNLAEKAENAVTKEAEGKR